jgi:prevent-host-death family protein
MRNYTNVVNVKMSVITATEANRSFSKLLRAVERGEKIAITSHGRKIAVLVPAEDGEARKARQMGALERLQRRAAKRDFLAVGTWTRDDLNSRD